MGISVFDAVTAAFERTKRMLFDPFDVRKWFVLGFCAWLATLGEGGFSIPSGSPNWNDSGQSAGGEFAQIRQWFTDYLALVILAGAVFILLAITIGLILAWVRARGKFMFLDGVVRNRGAVKEPWRQFRTLGNSLFWFNVVLGLVGGVAVALVLLAGVALAWKDIVAQQFGSDALTGILVAVLLIIPVGLVLLAIVLLVEDFIVPVMYVRGVKTVAAWRVFFHEILPRRVGPIFLFYLVKFALGLVVGTIVVCAGCATCCVAFCLLAIPYLGTVILLPLFVFMRSFSLCFIEQFGDPWKIFPPDYPIPTDAAPSDAVPPAAEPPALPPGA